MVYDPLSFSSTGGFTGNDEIHAALIAQQHAAINAAAAKYDPTDFGNTGGWNQVRYEAINPPPQKILDSTPPELSKKVVEDSDSKPKNDKTDTGSSEQNPVKVATPDLINAFSLQKYNDIPIDSMADIIFEDLGGQELLSVSRTDLINGQNIDYQPISNLGSISIANSPSNIIKLQSTAKAYFDSFPIVLEDYVPFVGTGKNGEIVYMDPYMNGATVTYNESNVSGENIIIGVINMTSDKFVQVEFVTYGNMINDIIYP